MKVSHYAKTIVAAVAGAAFVAKGVIEDGTLSASDIIEIALAVATALGVWGVPNAPADEV